METLFSLINILVAPFWLMMIFLPGARVTGQLMRWQAVILGPVIVYIILIAPDLMHIVPLLLRPELPAISALLGSERGATAAWAHFLAFDLFVGRWIYLDSRSRGISSWVTGPLLFLTLLLGPLGFITYFI